MGDLEDELMKLARNKKGFSLAELMVVVAVSSMVAYGVYASILTGNLQMQTSNYKMTMRDSAREGIYKMMQEVRLTAPGKIVAVGSVAPGFGFLEFDVPNENQLNNLYNPDFTIDWDEAIRVQYARGGQDTRRGQIDCIQLVRTVCGRAGDNPACPAPPSNNCPAVDKINQRVIANDVTSLSFANTNANIVEINVGFQRERNIKGQGNLMINNLGQSTPLEITTNVELRNS